MHGYIYITTNKANGMQYIGKRTLTVFDKNYLGSGLRLKHAIKVYGRATFDVEMIASANSKEELDLLEIEHIAQHDAMRSQRFYNIAEGGCGGITYLDRRRHVDPHMRRAAERYSELPEMLKTMSQSEAAAILGVDQSAVAQRVREHNIVVEHDASYHEKIQEKREAAAKLAHEARRKQGEATWAGHDLAKMYETMTQAQMAHVIGVSQVRVSQRLKQLGITKAVSAKPS